MSTLAIVLIVVAVLFTALFVGGLVVARRRLARPSFDSDVVAADRALEAARAADRGWDREVLQEAARRALEAEHPGFVPSSFELVLVDDRPGVVEDRAHLVASGDGDSRRVVLTREPDGSWTHERVE